jgi:ribosomal protein S24E
MENKIIEEKENPLFNRKEVTLEVSSNVNPKNDEALKIISEQFSTPEEQIKIKGIYGKFGIQRFKIIANIYKTLADKEKTEVKTKQEKEAEKKAVEEMKKAEEERRKAEAEAKAEAEKPTEENTEETKTEEVKEEEKIE